MSGSGYSQDEWDAWHAQQRSSGGYTDEEWARYRRQTAGDPKAAPKQSAVAPIGSPAGPVASDTGGSAATAPGSGSGCHMDVRNLLPLPAEWVIKIAPQAGNATHRKSDYSKLQHDANRMLRKMWTCWQRDLDRVRDEQEHVLRSAVMNQTTANITTLQSSQKSTQLEQQLQDTKALLSAALEEKEKLAKDKSQMELDFEAKHKADDLKKQMEHGAKIIMEVKRAKSPIKKELKAVKEDTIAYRAKCRHAFQLWRQHSDKYKMELEQVKLELRQTKLELALFKDPDFETRLTATTTPCSRIASVFRLQK